MKWIEPTVFSEKSGNPIFGQIFGHQRAENEARNTKLYRDQETHPIRVNARYETNWANSFFQKVPETFSSRGRMDERTDRHRSESVERGYKYPQEYLLFTYVWIKQCNNYCLYMLLDSTMCWIQFVAWSVMDKITLFYNILICSFKQSDNLDRFSVCVFYRTSLTSLPSRLACLLNRKINLTRKQIKVTKPNSSRI